MFNKLVGLNIKLRNYYFISFFMLYNILCTIYYHINNHTYTNCLKTNSVLEKLQLRIFLSIKIVTKDMEIKKLYLYFRSTIFFVNMSVLISFSFVPFVDNIKHKKRNLVNSFGSYT